MNSPRFVKELLLLAHPQAGQKGKEERGRRDGETNIKRERYMRDTAVSEQHSANLNFEPAAINTIHIDPYAKTALSVNQKPAATKHGA